MTDKKKAISITESFLRENEDYKSFRVDEAGIQERETLWYVPFKEESSNSDEIQVGRYHGLIVDKDSDDYLQPGSALDLAEWMYAFKIGLRGGRYDLSIEKVHDYRATLDTLEKLNLTYVKIEIEGGTEWKIPKSFSRKQIKKRVDKLPCVFKNQTFTFSMNAFKQIRNEGIFEYKLLKSENTDPQIDGELINE